MTIYTNRRLLQLVPQSVRYSSARRELHLVCLATYGNSATAPTSPTSPPNVNPNAKRTSIAIGVIHIFILPPSRYFSIATTTIIDQGRNTFLHRRRLTRHVLPEWNDSPPLQPGTGRCLRASRMSERAVHLALGDQLPDPVMLARHGLVRI